MNGDNGAASWKTKLIAKKSNTKANLQYENCHSESERSDDCVRNWQIGDGVGGSEFSLGSMNSCRCLKSCQEKGANGITMRNDGRGETDCYCEMNMKGSNGNSAWKTKMLKRQPVSTTTLAPGDEHLVVTKRTQSIQLPLRAWTNGQLEMALEAEKSSWPF